MGITAFSISLLQKALSVKPDIKTVGEYGAQVLYLDDKLRYASEWYEAEGIEYTCFDLAGDNNATKVDLSFHAATKQFDLVTDFGQSEHIVRAEEYVTTEFNSMIHSVYPKGAIDVRVGFYYAWVNKYNMLKTGGIMVNENPLTGHWKGHGYSYIDEKFYHELANISGLKVLEVGTTCAMGNCETGKNVYSIMQKVSNIFPSIEEFYNALTVYNS